MEPVKMYIEISDELHKVILDNNLDLSSIVREEDNSAKLSYQPIPYENESGMRSKDVALTILAGSAGILAIGAAISQIFKTVYRKPYLVQYYDLVEIRDSQGMVVVDSFGNPLLKQVKKY